MSKAAALAVTSPAPSPAPVPQSSPDDAILALIERAARDPSVDIERMERMFAMYDAMKGKQAKAAFLEALADLQAEMPAVARRGKAHNDKKYARFEDIIETVRAPLQQHGFSLTFRLDQQSDKLRVTGVLGHRQGHSEQTDIVLAADGSGNKNAVQAWGSSVSYGKRYVALALLGIATEDDDDGRAAGAQAANGLISAAQLAELEALMAEHNVSAADFCNHYDIGRVADVPARYFAKVVEAITSPKRKGGAGR